MLAPYALDLERSIKSKAGGDGRADFGGEGIQPIESKRIYRIFKVCIKASVVTVELVDNFQP
ncbi:MAG: hypothetical protein ABWX93_03660 [Pseudoxanthomonas sp.]